ncbi:MAG: PLP-dependent aminotransferase family protein [Rhodospirillales bacterium]|nr:PLP-dependent aminotransferase family protein [Rhodospirillales bacterium]
MIFKWHPQIADRPGPRYLAIVDLLADAIADGNLRSGDRLPTHRALAARLGVTVTTVTRAYDEAERRGLVIAEVGRGTFVRESAEDSVEASLGAAPPAQAFVNMAFDRPSPAGPAAKAMTRHTAEFAATGNVALLPGDTSNAQASHREAGAEWIARRIGRAADPARVLVAAGTQNAILLAIAAVAGSGDTMLVETLTSYGTRTAAGILGVRLAGVRTDGEGMLPEALEAAIRRRKPKAVFLTPTFHMPTTATMSPERRSRIVEVCRRHGMPIVEEDCYGFLDDAAVPIAALAPERTVHFVSLSKSVSSALPVAYVHAPTKAVDRALAAMRATTYSTMPLACEIATRMIRSGDALAAANWYRDTARRRAALAGPLLETENADMNPGALHLWLHLPERWPCDEFAEAARLQGVGVLSSRAFSLDGSPEPNAVRVCFSAPDSDAEVRAGFERLAELLAGGGGRADTRPKRRRRR